VSAKGKVKETDEGKKRKLEQWRKKTTTKESKIQYRKERYIREYNNKFSKADKDRIKESTLKKYGLSKYDNEGNVKDLL
jgi:hypothetical protein